MEQSKKTIVQSVKKALDMLDLVIECDQEGGAALSWLAEKLSMPRNSAHNLLRTLVACDYVEQRGSRGVYAPGSKCRQLVRLSQFDSAGVREAIAARMKQFVDSTGEDCVMAVLVNGRRVVINYAGSRQTVRVARAEIEKDSFYRMPTGRMLAAIADENELEQIISRHGLPGELWKGIKDKNRLRHELAALSRQGYCHIGEDGDVLAALACPVDVVGGGTGRPCGVVGTFAPVYRCSPAKQQLLLVALKQLAADLAQIIPVKP